MSFEPSDAPPRPSAPSARWIVFTSEGVMVDESPEGPRFLDAQEAGSLELSDPLYLGRSGGEEFFTARALASPLGGPSREARPLRSLLMELDDERGALAGRASQVLHWDETHRFCGRCGAQTERSNTERSRRCPACDLSAYPRISPAVIVLVRRGERALLARAASFRKRFFSTLAGFVEPGETLEETVAREIREEVSVEVKNVRYFGSQPWPFPHSLMVGFTAEHAGGEIEVDGVEIAEADFFAADELPPVPPKISIARRLIDAWLEDVGAL